MPDYIYHQKFLENSHCNLIKLLLLKRKAKSQKSSDDVFKTQRVLKQAHYINENIKHRILNVTRLFV